MAYTQPIRGRLQTPRSKLRWERQQLFNLPVTEAVSGQSATLRSAPRLPKGLGRPPPLPHPMSEEQALDQLWNDQASAMQFQRLLEEERYFEEAERSIEEGQRAIDRELLLMHLRAKYKKDNWQEEAQKKPPPFQAGAETPRHRGAPYRGRKVGLPWSYKGAEILKTERSLLGAGWKRKDIDEFLLNEYGE